jgi:uncharacterized membrane protein
MAPWYLKKSTWLVIVSAVALLIQAVTGTELVISVESQAIILAVINIIVQAITRKELVAGIIKRKR